MEPTEGPTGPGSRPGADPAGPIGPGSRSGADPAGPPRLLIDHPAAIWLGRALAAAFGLMVAGWVGPRLGDAARDLLGPLLAPATARALEHTVTLVFLAPAAAGAAAVGLYGAAAAHRRARGEAPRDELRDQAVEVTLVSTLAWSALRLGTALVLLAPAALASGPLGSVLLALGASAHLALGPAALARWLDEGALLRAFAPGPLLRAGGGGPVGWLLVALGAGAGVALVPPSWVAPLGRVPWVGWIPLVLAPVLVLGAGWRGRSPGGAVRRVTPADGPRASR